MITVFRLIRLILRSVTITRVDIATVIYLVNPVKSLKLK